MNFQEYINKRKEFYNLLANFIGKEEEEEEGTYQSIISYIDDQKIKDPKSIKEVLYQLVHISNNHHRHPNLFKKIEQIISYLESDIKQTFSNSEIFDVFKSNQILLLFLFEKKIINVDNEIKDFLIETNCHFFYPEIKSLVDDERRDQIESDLFELDSNILNKFEEKRRKGENDSYICYLISNDLIDEFVAYVNKTNFDISSHVKKSIFETNEFLKENKPTLIEYAAFHGSIQIFNYLRLNKIGLTKSLWIYAIHSNNPELIHLLEENKVEPENQSYETCLFESIKCHHNEIARYIQNNFITEKNQINDFAKNVVAFGFHFYNYEFIPDDLNNEFVFYYACQYDYFSLVKLLLNIKEIDVNKKII